MWMGGPATLDVRVIVGLVLVSLSGAVNTHAQTEATSLPMWFKQLKSVECHKLACQKHAKSCNSDEHNSFC